MANGERTDPLVSFRFRVEIDNLIQAGFAECSGLQVETELEEVREGGENAFQYKLLKGSKYVNLTLKRGMTDSDLLWNWHKDVVNGKVQRKMVYVVLLDPEGQETWRWSLQEALPVKWTGPELKADGSTVAIESLELAHHGFSEVRVTKR
jgi:phage tail-like protein